MSSKWPGLISSAERLLGGPAPFINLDLLLSSETGFLAARAKRLVSTVDHPFFDTVYAYLRGKTVKYPFLPLPSKMLPQSNSDTPITRASGGLITLLLGQCCAGAQAGCVKLCSQHRKVAEIFETVNLAITIHKSLVVPTRFNDPAASSRHTSGLNGTLKDLEAGNKVATLAGDVLLASVSSSLASFHNAEVVDIVSEAMSDMLEAEHSQLSLHFHNSTDSTPRITPEASPDEQATQWWLTYIGQARGSLLGACCHSTVVLSHPIRDRSMLALGHIARQLGHSWASLVRLLDERECVRRVRNSLENNSGQPAHVNYLECGLPEPTLADAFNVVPQISPATIASVLVQYNAISLHLLANLRGAFHNLRTATSGFASGDRSLSSAIELLGELIDELAIETTS